MEIEGAKGVSLEGRHRGERHKRKEHHSQQRGGGAKTFRRGRAIAFLEMMNLKRATLKQQLDAPEFQTIHQILVGELKAIDMVINEFSQLFEIHESEAMEISNNKNAVDLKKNHDESREINKEEEASQN
ncbi:hypothetical protein [Litchfieldia alkalitelluris]|uniref:hypothetical protein n=1 Tax=Litchfieldia alkalitelluris TaxID=304268 RepID=UPI000998733E|nr:hypothetical protein [Litchfieldia alkalitelluris]